MPTTNTLDGLGIIWMMKIKLQSREQKPLNVSQIRGIVTLLAFQCAKKRGKMGNKILTLYEIGIQKLSLTFSDNTEMSFPEALASGRANYMIFEALVRENAGLGKTKGSDHEDEMGRKYEQKAYEDPELHTKSKDLFRCSASSTFGANNNGPKIKKLLEDGNYQGALDICMRTGYEKNDFYVFSNSGNFKPAVPFRYFIVPQNLVVQNLDSDDPRMISRSRLFSMIESKVVLI